MDAREQAHRRYNHYNIIILQFQRYIHRSEYITQTPVSEEYNSYDDHYSVDEDDNSDSENEDVRIIS